MENKRRGGGGGGGGASSSSSSSLDHLFGPKDSSSSSSSSSVFGSIFSSPSTGLMGNQIGNKYGNPDSNSQSNKGGSTSGISGTDSSSMYQNETTEPSYLSSSIYYGGQENYSPRTKNSESHHTYFKKDDKNDGPNGNDSNSASRGNWWQGSFHY